jgi:hypothetical protein
MAIGSIDTWPKPTRCDHADASSPIQFDFRAFARRRALKRLDPNALAGGPIRKGGEDALRSGKITAFAARLLNHPAKIGFDRIKSWYRYHAHKGRARLRGATVSRAKAYGLDPLIGE